jgi:hypothetical protein
MNRKQWISIITGLICGLTAILSWGSPKRAGAPPSLPPGTHVQLRITEALSSETAKPGQTFHGTLDSPIVVNGQARYPRGASVSGLVLSAHRSGRLSGPGVLELALTSVTNGGSSSVLNTEPFYIKGASHTKNNATKIGGGTAVGAIIGGVVGGGKGAAIGAGVGAGAGTATAAATGVKPATVESEAVLLFVIAASTPAPAPAQIQVLRSSEPPYSDHRSVSEPPYEDRRAVSEEYARPSPSRRDRDDDDEDDDRDRRHEHQGYAARGDGGYFFGDRDREVLQRCLDRYDFEGLPPGIQKKLARGGTLPPGLARRQRPLPDSCSRRLPRLPGNYVRVIVGNRVIILEGGSHIADMLIF